MYDWKNDNEHALVGKKVKQFQKSNKIIIVIIGITSKISTNVQGRDSHARKSCLRAQSKNSHGMDPYLPEDPS